MYCVWELCDVARFGKDYMFCVTTMREGKTKEFKIDSSVAVFFLVTVTTSK